jgi:very-short-patch-repair endonuclease
LPAVILPDRQLRQLMHYLARRISRSLTSSCSLSVTKDVAASGVRRALRLVDAGAESPRETWLRLLLIRAGFPAPQTQVPVYDEYGQLVAVLDMGWESLKLAVEYDGDHHWTDRRQFNKDIRRAEALADLGWIDIRVTAEDTEGGVIARVRAAWEPRACNVGAISVNSPP